MENFIEVEDHYGDTQYIAKENIWRIYPPFDDDQQTIIVLNELEDGNNKEITVNMPLDEFRKKLIGHGLSR